MLAIQFSQGVQDAWSNVATFVPKFIGFLVILVIGYIIARMIAKVADKALERAGFDKAVERGGVGRALETSSLDPSDIVSKLIFYTLFLFVLQFAFGVFGTNPISDLLASVVAYLPKVFIAIVIIVVASAIAAAVKEIIQASLGGLSYGRAVAVGASAAILVIAAFAALDQLDIAPSVVTGLFYAMLAIIAGSAIIAIGGGGIVPMRQRWERALARIDDEAPKVRQQAKGSTERIKDRAEELKGKAQEATTDNGADAAHLLNP